ncbi:hypothetical protein N752_12185 [Desulforamulus aquiferis]|nr:hypothetical protein [Desulforamulus aquiferis]RYD04939.1 hypothetical protein N752_12185 [Desulforamulus aquiferis]
MAQYQSVFKRYEKKYLMNEQQYQALKGFCKTGLSQMGHIPSVIFTSIHRIIA